jgi:hypothetical protein
VGRVAERGRSGNGLIYSIVAGDKKNSLGYIFSVNQASKIG